MHTRYDQALIEYLVYFHAYRDYFECHEVLEEHWKAQPDRDKLWVGLIQLAVGFYHQRRNNFDGALKLLKSAHSILETRQADLKRLGFQAKQMIDLIEKKVEAVRRREPYESIHLPIYDSHLMDLCLEKCADEEVTWGQPSDLDNHYLLHKHRLRDRSEIIEEREKQRRNK